MRSVAISKKSVIMGYICSCCGSPVLSVLRVEAKAQGHFIRTWNLKKKEERIQIAAQKAVLETIRKIEQCKKICTTADIELKNRSILSMRSYCDMSVKEFGHPCSNCMNSEPWMPARLSKKDLLDLKEENFPTIFETYKEAESWALRVNEGTIAQTEKVRQSEQAIEEARMEADRLSNHMGALEIQKATLPELAQGKTLYEEKMNCLCKKEKLGMLHFKRRKAVNERIKVLTYLLEKNNTELREKQSKIDMQIKETRAFLEKAQAVVYGCSGRSFKRKSGNCVSFQTETNKPLDGEITEPATVISNKDTADLELEDKTVFRRFMI